MSAPYYHALSSVKKWGGTCQDYLPIHSFLDSTKSVCPTWRHRALLHSAWGISIAERIFGSVIETSDTKKIVAVRDICERHIQEDLSFVPSAEDWLKNLGSTGSPPDWMTNKSVDSKVARIDLNEFQPCDAGTTGTESVG